MRKGIIAASSDVWHPNGFITSPSDGSWWRGVSVQNKWTDIAGTDPVDADGDWLGRWRDAGGTRDLEALFIANSLNNRARWSGVENAANIQVPNSTPVRLFHTLSSPVALAQDVTLMVRFKVPTPVLNSSLSLSIGQGVFGNTHIRIAFNATNIYATLRSSGGNQFDSDTLWTPYTPGIYHTVSVIRSAALGGRLTDLYLDGVRVVNNAPNSFGGPTVNPSTSNAMNEITIGSNQAASDPRIYIKDFILAFKKATPADHIGYHSYTQALI